MKKGKKGGIRMNIEEIREKLDSKEFFSDWVEVTHMVQIMK